MAGSILPDPVQPSLPPLLGTFSADSSYPSGGYPISRVGRIGHIKGIEFIAQNAAAAGLTPKWDSVAGTIKVNKRTPQLIVVEEPVVVASNVGRLANIPGYIIGLEVTAGGTTGAFTIIPVGKVPTTTQVAVEFVTGIMTFLSTDAVTAVRVTYIPLGVGPFIEANRVIDEVCVAASSTFNTANRAALIQYVFNNTAASAARRPKLIPVGESPGSNEIAIDINNSTATSVTVNASQDTNSYRVTYWKFSAIGLAFGWTDQADLTVTSNAIVFPEALDLDSTWIGAFGDVVIGETAGAANLQARLIGPSGTAAANVAVFDPAKNVLTLASGDAYVTVESAYIVLNPAVLNASTEVPVGTNMTGAVWEVAIFGNP